MSTCWHMRFRNLGRAHFTQRLRRAPGGTTSALRATACAFRAKPAIDGQFDGDICGNRAQIIQILKVRHEVAHLEYCESIDCCELRRYCCAPQQEHASQAYCYLTGSYTRIMNEPGLMVGRRWPSAGGPSSAVAV